MPNATTRERNPGHRRDGRQQRDHRVRQLVEDAQRERQATHQHGSHEGQRQAAHDAHEAGPDRRESDEVPPIPLDADLRQEELRLVLDLGDEDAGGGRITRLTRSSAAASSQSVIMVPTDKSHHPARSASSRAAGHDG